jgi:hypothetical protein
MPSRYGLSACNQIHFFSSSFLSQNKPAAGAHKIDEREIPTPRLARGGKIFPNPLNIMPVAGSQKAGQRSQNDEHQVKCFLGPLTKNSTRKSRKWTSQADTFY